LSPQIPRRKGAAYGLPVNIPSVLATASDVQQMISHGINPDGSLSPEAIRALLKLKGIQIRTLAELHGMADPILHQVINREFRNEAVENVIAEALRFNADRMWGRRSTNVA